MVSDFRDHIRLMPESHVFVPAWGGRISSVRHIYDEIHLERIRAHTKHGAKGSSREDAAPNDKEWLAILGEEYGEVCHELTYDSDNQLAKLRAELIQVAAMAAAWIEAIDNG